jgi:hypothetical protein
MKLFNRLVYKCIREVLGWNLRQDINYHDSGFPQSLQGQYIDATIVSFPILSVHQSPYHPTLRTNITK